MNPETAAILTKFAAQRERILVASALRIAAIDLGVKEPAIAAEMTALAASIENHESQTPTH